MSADSAIVQGGFAGSVRDVGGRTRIAITGALGRRDGKAILLVTSIAYFLLYLVGLDHLGRGDGTVSVIVADDPLSRALHMPAPFQFEPIALVELGPIEALVAPGNLLIGTTLAGLIGTNLAVSWVAWRGPSACRIGAGAGVAAGLPGLLSGFACCGPTILIVIGVQASAGLLIVFQWLIPIAVVGLVASLFYVGTQVELPDAG